MAGPQVENGYTRVANEIIEQICKLKLNGTQFKIIMVVWRYTYGFQRKEHKLSLSFISNATDCDKRQIQRELKSLEEKNIIIQDVKSGSYRKISFNKNFDSWLIGKDVSVGETTIGEITVGKSTNSSIGKSTNSSIGKSTNINIGESTNQEIKKKNLKKDTSTLFEKFWVNYPKKVAKAAAKKSFNKLKIDEQLLEQMLKTLEIQKQSKQWNDKTYIPYPATYLNQRRFEDELEEVNRFTEVKMTSDGSFKF